MDRYLERGQYLQVLQEEFSSVKERFTLATKRVSLYGGRAATIRPVRPDDALLIYEMHQRLSPDSIYNRYLRPSTPPLAEIERLCHIDERQGAAFVVTMTHPTEKIIGVAYYMIEDGDNPHTAEPAILVEDRFQGQGLGRRLFKHLCQQAQANGIHTFNALISAANGPVMGLIYRSGLPFEESISYGTREARIQLNSAKETLYGQLSRAAFIPV